MGPCRKQYRLLEQRGQRTDYIPNINILVLKTKCYFGDWLKNLGEP